MPEKNKSNELKLTRAYDAPVKAVWEAWTDPEQAAKWWGPRGFTITTHSKILKPGGHWHYTMHGPDGVDYPNKAIYHEVEKYKRLVYDHGANDERPPLFRVTVLFKEIGHQTRMEMTMTCPTPEAAEQTKKFIKIAGGNSTWDRLAEYLEKESLDKDIFVINRSFEASIETLFEMWTDSQHSSQWLVPVLDGKINDLKIKRPEYLEYIHPTGPVWSKPVLTRVLLSKEQEGQTRVTVIWEPYGDVSEAERQAFAQMKASMTQGWTEAFDKLENSLIE